MMHKYEKCIANKLYTTGVYRKIKSQLLIYALLDPPIMLQSNAESSSNANADMSMTYCIPSDAYANAGVNAEMRCFVYYRWLSGDANAERRCKCGESFFLSFLNSGCFLLLNCKC